VQPLTQACFQINTNNKSLNNSNLKIIPYHRHKVVISSAGVIQEAGTTYMEAKPARSQADPSTVVKLAAIIRGLKIKITVLSIPK
jgi:hypothetical protein